MEDAIKNIRTWLHQSNLRNYLYLFSKKYFFKKIKSLCQLFFFKKKFVQFA